MLQSREQAIEFIKGVPDDRLHYVMMLLNYIRGGFVPDKPAVPVSGNKKLGGMEGKIWMADDFNAPLDCFEEYMP
jgi:hypothetical protein